jgi:6-pyruvoyl-tetrahydropterin synthase
MGYYLEVKHNIEVAHRLYNTPGKCEQIHGHSMWVTMSLQGDMGPDGMLVGSDGPLEFGKIKRVFRSYLDEHYDHRLLLNASDPFSRPIFTIGPETKVAISRHVVPDNPTEPYEEAVAYEINKADQKFLPGLQSTFGDPTTENIAMWIGEYMTDVGLPVLSVQVQETAVNGAVWMPQMVNVIDQETVDVVERLQKEGRL